MSKKYLCIQRRTVRDLTSVERPTTDQLEVMYKNSAAKYKAFNEQFHENVSDIGGRLGMGMVVSANGTTDGAFTESKLVVHDYMVVVADHIEEAVKVARARLLVDKPGATVEVREIKSS